jgi:hypothetical protein
MSMPTPTEMASAIRPVVAIFDQLRIPYLIGGSVASGVHGEGRGTRDVDILADLRIEHVKPFVSALGEDVFYADEDAIRMAIGERSSFNLIHRPAMVKVDIFIPKQNRYATIQLARRIPRVIAVADNMEAQVATAEDSVLAKLDWYRLGGEVSDRQWNDILGILKTQRDRLDKVYLREWATELKVADLLDRAFEDAAL